MKAAFRRLIRPLLELQLKRLIARHHLKVVAVAGSVGKTTTKTAIATVLGQKYRVLVHEGNYNDTVSIPLAAFGLDVPSPIINPLAWIGRLWRMETAIRGHYPYQALVLELGTDHPGELPHFMSYLRPDFGVVTAIAPEHMEFFKTLEAVAEEEFSLARGSRQAILNDAFDHLHPLAKNLKPQPLWYSAATLKPFRQALPVARPPHIEQALGAAVVVARELKLTDQQIATGLAKFRGVPGRMQQLAGVNGSMIIDDSYNSSPDAVVAALSYVASLPVTGRRVAILGTMNELGADSPRYHQEVGRAAAGVDVLVTIGRLAGDYLGPAALAAGLDPAHFRAVDSPYAAGELVKALLEPGDVVLAKGSQNGVFAEEAVKLLLADPADAAKLVRQSPAWLATKRAQFADAN